MESSLEPVHIPTPGEKGFKVHIHADCVVACSNGQHLRVKAGDVLEWNGEKWLVNGKNV